MELNWAMPAFFGIATAAVFVWFSLCKREAFVPRATTQAKLGFIVAMVVALVIWLTAMLILKYFGVSTKFQIY